MSRLRTRIRTLEKRHALLDRIPGVPVAIGFYGPGSVLIFPRDRDRDEVLAEAKRMRAKGCYLNGKPLPEDCAAKWRTEGGEAE